MGSIPAGTGGNLSLTEAGRVVDGSIPARAGNPGADDELVLVLGSIPASAGNLVLIPLHQPVSGGLPASAGNDSLRRVVESLE